MARNKNHFANTFSPKKYIKRKARQLPIHSTYISENWEETGMAVVIVNRTMPSGHLIVGLYMVDVFCLGVKDTHFRYKLTNIEFNHDFLPELEQRSALQMELCDPQLAFNVVYGALEYAEDIGFQPHKDFKLTEWILPDVESIEYMEIEFGKDGKPLYFQGPNDNVRKILAQLDKLGEGNYNFVTMM